MGVSSKYRVVHLTIRDGDDINKVAGNFCKTYALNASTKSKLLDQLRQYLPDQQFVSEPIDQHYLQRNQESS